MKALIKRFAGSRLARILGGTAAAITWAAVGLSSSLTDSSQSEAIPVEPTEPEVTPSTSVAAHVVESFPEEPMGGLVILRGIPVENPEPVTVVRRVVVQSQPSVSPAPPTQESSGS